MNMEPMLTSQSGTGTGAVNVLSSEAQVKTAAPSRYLSQLSKHFEHGHSLSVIMAGAHGRIAFPAGVRTLIAEVNAELLVMVVSANDTLALAWIESIVERHLLRFAFRDEPRVDWVRVA